jgi:hypothetical protein
MRDTGRSHGDLVDTGRDTHDMKRGAAASETSFL